METGKRVAGMVAVVLLLQLMAAPITMARNVAVDENTPLVGLLDIAMEVNHNQLPICGETCVLGRCYTPNCRCQYPICVR
uniref:Panitide L2 n=1 Tax=Steinchisma laxum TaxID=158129 RepID=K9Y2Z0_9POAL|nr:panitide L2 [Steinchisma laxum]